MRYSAVIPAILFFYSCNEIQQQEQKAPENNNVSTAIKEVTKDTAFHPGYIISLPENYKVSPQNGADFTVYYFTPKDSSIHQGEAGIYFGPRPDTASPAIEHSRKQFPGTFLGREVIWTEYTTATYTQRETFIEMGEGQKIHSWCYSNNTADLELLFSMIKTIR